GALLLRHARAARDVPRRARDGCTPAGSGLPHPRVVPGRRLDGYGLARHHGRSGAKRACGSACGARERSHGKGAGRGMTALTEPKVDAAVATALELGVERLLALQHEAGWWKGELETNVTMDAEDLLLRQFLGIRTDDQTRLSAQWIRSQQRADGTWATFFGG